jgi:predicted permease
MTILLNVVLPVFLVAGVAALAQTRLRFNIQTLSRVVFYLFAPALVFDSLAASDVSGAEFGQITAVLLLTTAALWVLGAIAGRLLHLEGPTQAAFLAAIVLMNAGNYGLSIDLFAFGQAGLDRATLYFAGSAVLSSSLGVYLTASGRVSPRHALGRVASVPLVYAAALGLIVNLAHLTVPEPLQKAVHLLGQASVPTMLAVLGVNLTETVRSQRRAAHLPALKQSQDETPHGFVPGVCGFHLGIGLGTVTVFRLIVAPALAWLFAGVIGLQGLTRHVVTLESAMPTAVITTILATEFESDPPFAALCVLVTTLVSLPTVAILLNWLMG